MPIYIFKSPRGSQPVNCKDEIDALSRFRAADTEQIEFAPTGKIIWEKPIKFKVGDRVRKIRGSEWQGKIVGAYSTELTADGYVVESDSHAGSCQIYPSSALELL